MQQTDAGSRLELAVRSAVVFLGMLAATVASNDIRVAILLSGYFICNTVFNIAVSRAVRPVPLGAYSFIVVSNMIAAGCYSVCAALLFSYQTPAFIVIGICAAIAQALYNVMRHQAVSIMAIWDTALVCGLAIYFGLTLVGLTDDPSERLIIFISSVGTAIYLLVAQAKSIGTHQELQQARANAIETQTQRAVGQLTAGIAHDFNNLVTAIRGNVELIEVAYPESPIEHYLQEAKNGVDRVSLLTGHLLSFSRKARLVPRDIDVADFLRQFRDTARATLPPGVQLSVTNLDTAGAAYCDPVHLESVLLSCVMNAVEAMEDQGEIAVLCAPPSAALVKRLALPFSADHYVMLEVRDTGCGIPPENLAKVTEPFFTTKNVGEGSGLGLSMAKGFARQSKGGLHVESTLGKGTTLALVLPKHQL